VPLDAIDELYVFGRQDNILWMNELEGGWNVSLNALNGTELWNYDWPVGRSPYPAVWRREAWPLPPPPLTPAPPAVQAMNSPCERRALL
jgi:hypothetical protein